MERNGRIPRSWHELARNVSSLLPPRVEEDRRRKPRASVKGGRGRGRKARGHREGLIFLIGRGRGTARWRVRSQERAGFFEFLSATESDSAAISHYQLDIFVKLDFRVRKPATLTTFPPFPRPHPRNEFPEDRLTTPLEYIYIYISFSTIETRPDHLFLATSNEKIDSTFKGEAKETRLRRLCLKDCKNVGILFIENVTLYFLLPFLSFPSPSPTSTFSFCNLLS